jgi:predicted N-formylglutamate amidohydrolase
MELHQVHPGHETAEVLNPDGTFPVLFLVEHAGNRLPPEVSPYLGTDHDFMQSYQGYDIGIPHVARRVANKLGATCILGVFSRLLIDLNREANSPEVLHREDDGIIIPGNQHLTEGQLNERLEKYHQPFHEICSYHTERLRDIYDNPVVFAFHSYPRHQRGYAKPSPWNVTVHHDQSFGLDDIFLDFLAEKHPELKVGHNDPYDLRNPESLRGFMIHGQENGLVNLEVEIVNDQLRDPEGIEYWAGICTEILSTLPEKLDIRLKDHSSEYASNARKGRLLSFPR